MSHRVAFLGFTEFERHALTSYFRLAHQRKPSYEHVAMLTDADYLVADADHGPSVQLVLATERLDETVFIGAQAPEGCAARMMRPIDALHVMRELDGIVARHTGVHPRQEDAGHHTTIIQAMRRQATDPGVHGPVGPDAGWPEPEALEPAALDAAALLGDLPFSAPNPVTAAQAAPALPGAPDPRPQAPGGAAAALAFDLEPAAGPDFAIDEAFDPTPPADSPLTLRDLPTPATGELLKIPTDDLFFPGTEGLVGHEPRLPAPPGGWGEDVSLLRNRSVLHDLPVLHDIAPAAQTAPAPAAAPPVPAPLPVARQPASPAPPAPPARNPPSLAALAVKAPTKPPKAPKVPKAPLIPGVPRALLVDDSAIALLFLEKRLERWRIDIDQASNSPTALALLAQHSYDLVFLDVELGDDSELDGLGLCQHIKQTPALMNALVVMVSVHHSELDRVRGALAGCDAYLGKPLDEAELQRLLLRQGLTLPAAAGAAQA